MAAPERFADRSDSSCTAGAVHTWPIATNFCNSNDVAFGAKRKWARRESPLPRSKMTPLRHCCDIFAWEPNATTRV